MTGYLDQITEKTDFQKIDETLTFDEYLEKVRDNPDIVRKSYQRVYDMIMSYGTRKISRNGETLTRYNFFDGKFPNNKDQIFGLEKPLSNLVRVLKSAALGMGPEKRVILLHGPVGSSKSTIVRMIKRGFEHYTKTDAGAMYTFEWCMNPDASDPVWEPSPMRDEPLLLVPQELREDFLKVLFEGVETRYPIEITKDLNPSCNYNFMELQKKYGGDWRKVLKKHIRVRRILVSEKDRVCIGTFQPKDEKNQDSTELTGDINYRKIAVYGSDSDPRVMNFDGEFCVSNRGIIEFVEILKLDTAFLYDLLTATQEHKIKPKKFAQVDIDEVIISSTNEAELKKLQNNELMEAFRDRTIKIDIPYLTDLKEEEKIYSRDFYNGSPKLGGKFIAPHTLKIASMWAILTRLEEPNNQSLSLLQKLKLYNGKEIPGFTNDNVKELKDDTKREGLDGISPRYIQDKIAEALFHDSTMSSVNPFIVMNMLEGGLKSSTLISDEKVKEKYKSHLATVKEEYEEIIKNEVQKAISADDDAIRRLYANYIDNINAYCSQDKIRNPYTNKLEPADERLMRSIEEKIGIPEARKDSFRSSIMNAIGAATVKGREFNYESNERLQKALEMKLFEDQKDTIKLQSIVRHVVDRETQEKIDIVKSRLIKDYGYDEISATDVLNYVASIYARGDIKN